MTSSGTRLSTGLDALGPTCAASPDLLKVKRHLFEPLDIALDHPRKPRASAITSFNPAGRRMG